MSAKGLPGLLVKMRAMMWCRSYEPIVMDDLTRFSCHGTETHNLLGLITDLHAMQGAVA